MLYRLLAAFASIAHGLERSVRATFEFLPVPISAVPLTIGLLAAGAALTTAATIEAIASQPEAQPTTIAEIVEPEGAAVIGWVRVDGFITAEHVIARDLDDDGQETPEEALRYYVFADAEREGHALLVRAHRPLGGASDRVTLSGVLSNDPSQSDVFEEREIARALEGATFSTTRVLVEGSSPAVPFRPSFTPSIVMAVTALLLLVSWLIPYPVFISGEPAAHASTTTRGLSSGDAIAFDLRGRLPTPTGHVRLGRVPARLARMTVDEVARRRWQYWGAELDALAQGLEEETLREAGGRDELLVLYSGHASVLLTLGTPSSPAVRLDPGDVYTAAGRRSGLRISGEGVDAMLAFRDEADRDRALAEIRSEESRAHPAPAVGEAGAARGGLAERLRPGGVERPWAITLAALLLAGLGVMTAVGAFTTADATDIVQPPIAVGLRLAVAIGAAVALVAAALGMYAGREWGRILVVNLALVGLFVAFVSLVSSQVCLQPVGPTYSCEPERETIDRLVSVVTLATLAFGLWAAAAGAAFFGESPASPQPALN